MVCKYLTPMASKKIGSLEVNNEEYAELNLEKKASKEEKNVLFLVM